LAVHHLPEATVHYYGRGDAKYVGPTGPQIANLAKESDEIGHLREIGRRLIEPGG